MNAITMLNEQLKKDFILFLRKLQTRIDSYNKSHQRNGDYTIRLDPYSPIVQFNSLASTKRRNDYVFVSPYNFMYSARRMASMMTYYVNVPYYGFFLDFSFCLECNPYLEFIDNTDDAIMSGIKQFLSTVVKDKIVYPEVMTFRSVDEESMDIVNEKTIREALMASYADCTLGRYETARALVETYAVDKRTYTYNKAALKIIVDMVLETAISSNDIELQAYILDISNKYHLSDSVEDMTL